MYKRVHSLRYLLFALLLLALIDLFVEQLLHEDAAAVDAIVEDEKEKEKMVDDDDHLEPCSRSFRYERQKTSLECLGVRLHPRHPLLHPHNDEYIIIEDDFCRQAMLLENSCSEPLAFDPRFCRPRVTIRRRFSNPRDALLDCHNNCTLDIYFNPLFDGEYGNFLITVLPFVYFASRCGMLAPRPLRVCFSAQQPMLYFHTHGIVEGGDEMLPTYNDTLFKSGAVVERYAHSSLCTDPRRPVYDLKSFGVESMVPKSVHHYRPKNAWLPPPFQRHYLGRRLPLPLQTTLGRQRPLVVVFNKFNSEWRQPPINYLRSSMLRRIFEQLLASGYDVAYNRADDSHTSVHNRTLNDFGVIEEFYNRNASFRTRLFDLRLLLSSLSSSSSSSFSYNELQLLIASRATCFISVQGGNSYLASYFGWHNLVYHLQGLEDYEYKGLLEALSGARVTVARSPIDFYSHFQRIFINGQECQCRPVL